MQTVHPVLWFTGDVRQLAKETTALKDICEDSQSCFQLVHATFQLLAVGSKLAEMEASGRETVWKYLWKLAF